MKTLLLVLLGVVLINATVHRTKDANAHPQIWALIVAGSNGWWNYRHQADACRAYHILRNHGIPANRIINMMYDDIANNEENPYPGKLFNEPDGPDVYEGCVIDYKGDDVTPENFLGVMKGDKTAVSGGNGRVLEHTSADHVFVYFTDHGGVGLIAFPDSILTVKELNDALKDMYTRQNFGQLTFYLEACESGSMFYNILKSNINVYAITAANEAESSWGYYCDNPQDLPCLGDMFSIMWLEDSEAEDLNTETLNTQFDIVRVRTNLSHVMRYGDLNIAKEMVADFQGWTNGLKKKPTKKIYPASAWPSRDIPLMHLKKQMKNSNTHMQSKLQFKVSKMELKRQYLDGFMADLVKRLVKDPVDGEWILNNPPKGITKLQCHDDVIKAFHNSCFHFARNPYAMKYAATLTNLCEYGLKTEVILTHLHAKCLGLQMAGIQ